MGLGEFFQQTATTVLLFKADVSDAKRGLKELQGEERKAAEQSVKLQEARNKSYEAWAKGITAANVAMKLGKESIDLLGSAWKSYEKQALAAGGADANKARAFRSALTEMSGAIDHMKAAVGRLVAGLEPLIRAAAFIVDKAAWVIDNIPSVLGSGSSGIGAPQSGSFVDKAIQAQRAANSFSYGQYAYGGMYAERDLLRSLGIAGSGMIQAGAMQSAAVADRTRPGPRGPRVDNSIAWDSENSLLGRYWGHTTGTYSGTGGALGGAGTDYGTGASAPGYYSGSEFDLTGMQQGFKGASGGMQEYAAGQSRSIMESYLGPIDDINAYQVAFQGLTSSVTAAFDAWVSGSMSAGAAAKAAIAMTLQALGKEMLIRALQETAMGFASLAIGGPIAGVSAGGHFKAAALFGAGAAAAGVASASLQSGGNQGGYGGPPSSYSGGGSRSSGSEGTTTIVYVGEGWTTSPAQQRAQTARAFRSARRELEGVDGVRDA